MNLLIVFMSTAKSNGKWIHLAHSPGPTKKKFLLRKISNTYPKKQFFKQNIFADPPERTDLLQKEKNSYTYPKKTNFPIEK